MNSSRNLIYNQKPYIGFNPFTEDVTLPLSAIQMQITKQKQSKHLKYPFQFSRLPNVLRYFAASFFTCSELVSLSSTSKANRNMLVVKDGKVSPYIIAQLRNIKVLTPNNLYNYKQMSLTTDASLILRECQNLVHLIAKGSLREHRPREAFITSDEIQKSLGCCPNLQYLSMLSFNIASTIVLIRLKPWKGLQIDKYKHTIYNSELKALEYNSELTHLSLKYGRHISDLNRILRTLENITYLEIPEEVSFGDFRQEPLNYQEVEELIDRYVYIRMIGQRNN